MTLAKNTKSYFTLPSKPIHKRIWHWATDNWHKDPRPFVAMLLTAIIGFIATILNLSSGWFFIFWISATSGVTFFGACYFIWNIASITIIILIERKQAEAEELIMMKYWLKRNILIAGMWASILLLSAFLQLPWPIIATVNGVTLAFIVMFAESEASPFQTGERRSDTGSRKRNAA